MGFYFSACIFLFTMAFVFVGGEALAKYVVQDQGMVRIFYWLAIGTALLAGAFGIAGVILSVDFTKR